MRTNPICRLALLASFLLPASFLHAQIDFTDWHTPAEINTELMNLAAAHPTIATTFSIGTSHLGNPIQCIKISDNVGIDDPNEGDVVFVSLHHAREWLTPEMALYLAEHLLDAYTSGADPELVTCINNLEIWIIPVLNPDGYAYTNTADRYWRKNRRNNGDGTHGVDLNRNYAYQWGGGSGIEGSTVTADDTYQGPFPFSEPETTAFRNFVQNLDHPKALLTYHTFSELILRPWSYSSADPPGEEIVKYIAQDSIARIAGVHGHTYGETIGYHAYGETTDYFWNGLRLAGFTPEMRPASGGLGGFDPPVSQIIPNNEENLPAAIALIKDAGLRKVWIKDHAADTGSEPSAEWLGDHWSHPFWTSPDIWTTPTELVEGSTVTLHVRVHNNTGSPLSGCKVQAYYTDPRVALEFPALSSVLIGEQSGVNVGPAGRTLNFSWTVPTGTNSWGERHWCVGAIVYHPDDRPLTTQIQKTSNIACRNFNTVPAVLTGQTLLVAVHNFLDVPAECRVTFLKEALPRGWTVHLPETRTKQRPHYDRLAKLVDAGGTILAPGQELLQPIRVTPAPTAAPGTTVDLDVHAVLLPVVAGKRTPAGNGYSFRIEVPKQGDERKNGEGGEQEGRQRPMFRIELEEPVELGLLRERFKIEPVRVDGRRVYYYGDEQTNRALGAIGYRPEPVNPDDVLTKVVRVRSKEPDAKEAAIIETGARVLLREDNEWTVRGTLRQLRLLSRLGFDVADVGDREPRPRIVRIALGDRRQIRELAPLLADVFGEETVENQLYFNGAAWDDSIDEIRKLGYNVEVLPRQR